MKTSDDNQTVYWLLMQVMFQAKHRIHAIAEQHGLTVMQANTLTMLQEAQPLAMNALSTYFSCDASNVTGIVDRLEAHNLIKRQDNPTDRRVKMIVLTAAGLDMRQKILEETIGAEAQRLRPVLTNEERSTLHGLLQKILANQPTTHK